MARYDPVSGWRETSCWMCRPTSSTNLNTRIVVPIRLPHDAPLPARRLNPVFEIDGRQYVMVTQFASAVRSSGLDEPVGSLGHYHDRIVAALDMLFQGF